MKKIFFLCLGFMLMAGSGFAEEGDYIIPYEVRLSQSQDLLVGDVISLEFYAEIKQDNWHLFSQTPYPAFKSIRPMFSPDGESVGIVWGESDLTRSISPVRESKDLTAPLIMDRHELVWAKKFKLTDKKATISGVLTGEFKEGFSDTLDTVAFEYPFAVEVEARDSTIKRWLMKSEKINDVLAVVVTIFLGLIVYIFVTQRKLKKLTDLADEVANTQEAD